MPGTGMLTCRINVLVRNQSSWLDDRRIHGRDSLPGIPQMTPDFPTLVFSTGEEMARSGHLRRTPSTNLTVAFSGRAVNVVTFMAEYSRSIFLGSRADYFAIIGHAGFRDRPNSQPVL
jgi:hypothetical protein